MVEDKKIITSYEIGNLFGLNSSFFKKSLSFLKNQAENRSKLFQEKYNAWKKILQKFYGNDATNQLFIKHTYFALLLKLFAINKLKSQFSLENKQFIEFEIYEWIELNSDLQNDFNNLIFEKTLKKEDIFQEIYQQIFFIITRHKIGEYYTFPKLAEKMVEDFYIFHSKILDPSCGSGTFLVEIANKIMDAKKSTQSKIEALEKIYGFDINPLAILSTKINLALIIHDFIDSYKIKKLNNSIFLIDSLFPEKFNYNNSLNLKENYNSFDLIIGNPPWLTYKDIQDKYYQNEIRKLSDELDIKPKSQYITHIELASIFFYALPSKFLKVGGSIFFVITKSVLTGDHCSKFRLFPIFRNLEIWDFPKNYIFNVNHICLKAKYIGKEERFDVHDNYPIKAKLYDENYQNAEEVYYNSFNINSEEVKIILPEKELKFLTESRESEYKSRFFQGATLVPRTLVFFEIVEKKNNMLKISSDQDVLKRSKKNWYFKFSNEEIEPVFRFKTFLNMDLIPFYLKKKRNVFLPINKNFEFELDQLKFSPQAFTFYNMINDIYKTKKKKSSKINSLISNLNYWNKLAKQINNKKFIVVYNASGSNLKATVLINDKKKLIIGSDNYYYSTDSQVEAYYLSAVLNTPELTRNIKIIKSSRHIHKRPFSFPIPIFNGENEDHQNLSKKGKKYHFLVQDLVMNNPKITTEKVRIILNKKLAKLDSLFKRILAS